MYAVAYESIFFAGLALLCVLLKLRMGDDLKITMRTTGHSNFRALEPAERYSSCSLGTTSLLHGLINWGLFCKDFL